MDGLRARHLVAANLDAALAGFGATAYFRTDQHWTPKAAEATAVALAPNLPHGIMRIPPLNAWFEETRLGDLATLLSPPERATIRPERFHFRTMVDDDLRSGYNMVTGETSSTGTALVRVVGNSFSRRMFGLPQRLAAAIGAEVDLTYLPGNAGPYHALIMALSTLPSQRPRAIVWQMHESLLQFGSASPIAWAADARMPPERFLARASELLKR